MVVVNRTRVKADAAASLAGAAGRVGRPEDASGADLVVNATPVGMTGTSTPLPGATPGAGQLVVDLLYEPVMTPLLVSAEAAGARVANGLGMLVHQAAHAFRLWTGEPAPVGAMAEAARSELRKRSLGSSG